MLIYGKEIREKLKEELKVAAAQLQDEHDYYPGWR